MVKPRTASLVAVSVFALAVVGLVQPFGLGGAFDAFGNSTGTPTAATDTLASEPAGEEADGLSFTDVARSTGINYSAAPGRTSRRKMLTDVGVYAADVDGDGWTDVFATGGDRPTLYLNDNGTFRLDPDAVPRLNRSVRSALFFDYDGDGNQDLLLLADDSRPLLLENDGTGDFRRADGGFEDRLAVPIGATTADFDGDGCLDLFVIQNGPWSDHPPAGMSERNVPPSEDDGLENVLYRGTCEGFERAEDAGIEGTRWSLATSAVDLDGDGLADIHVANDFNHDVVYRNRGNMTFEQVVLGNATDRNGMSSEVADVNGDGRPDLFVTNIYYPPVVNGSLESKFSGRAKGNNLLVNRGNLTFEDRAEAYGVRKGGWGWAAVFEDFDHDGALDLYHATMYRTFDGTLSPLSREEQGFVRRNYLYFRYPVVRAGNGSAFERVGGLVAGFDRNDGSGVAALDYDRDGDLDLVAANRTGPFSLYENAEPRHCRSVQVVPRAGHRYALGARVTVETGSGAHTEFATANTDFVSQGTRVHHFGVPDAERVDVRVTWPDGTTTEYAGVTAGRRVVVSKDGGITTAEPYVGCS